VVVVVVVVVFINAVIAVVAVVVVAHGPGSAEDSCLLVHDATSLDPSTRRTNQKLLAYFLRMGLVAGWIGFVANSQFASNFEIIS
jgi:hypothetical protein